MRRNAGGDDGMVIRYFRRVEHLFRFAQLLAAQRSEEIAVETGQAVENGFALPVHVVGKVGGVYARIGGELGFIKLLHDLECEVGTVAEFAVALHLQGGEVKESRRSFATFFLRHRRHRERRVFDCTQRGFRFGAVGETAFCRPLVLGSFAVFRFFVFLAVVESRGESRVAVDGGEHPIGFRHEAFDLLLSVYDESQSRGLHAPDAQRLCAASTAIAEFQRVQARGIHAQQPVADGTTQPGFVQSAVFFLRPQLGETFFDGFFCHRRNPQPIDRTLCRSLLHHPALDEFTFLAGIAAVDDAIGFSEKVADHPELFFHPLFEADAEAFRNHRQCR